jgi:hypothetical protein
MSDSLVAAYNKVAANKIAYLFDSLDKTFKELSYEMTRFASLDQDVHATYKKMVNDFLIKAMQERMGADNIHLEAIRNRAQHVPNTTTLSYLGHAVYGCVVSFVNFGNNLGGKRGLLQNSILMLIRNP